MAHRGWSDIWSAVSTGLLVVCAITATSWTIYRDQRRPAAPKRFESQPDWLKYATPRNRIGPEDARVRLVEFSDFQCPFCAKFDSVLREIRRRYPHDFAYMYRHFPVEKLHPAARGAAIASECAAVQGRFDSMNKELFAQRDSLVDRWLVVAERAGVADLGSFANCMRDSATADIVANDIAVAKSLGVTGTPVSLMNGVRIKGFIDVATMDSLFQAALAAKKD